MQQNNEKPAPTFPCANCGKVFMMKKSLNRHLRNHEEGQFKCGICHKEFTRMELLQKHELTHSKPEKAESRPSVSAEKLCHVCGENFKRLDLLKRHLLTHSTNVVYSCQVCEKDFNRKDNLLRHEGTHVMLPVPTPRGTSVHSCVRCNAEFTRKDALRRHEKKHASEPQFPCTKCSKVFARKDSLFDHLKVCRPLANNSMTKPTVVTRQCKSQFHVCEVCDARFTHKTNLTRHQRVHDQKKFRCEECGQSWTRKSKLEKHCCSNKEQNLTPETKTTACDRVKKSRIKKMFDWALPTSSTEKAIVIEHMIASPSKQTRTILENKGLMQTAQSQDETLLCKAVVADAKTAMSAIKAKRSTGATRIRQKVSAILIGENVKSIKKKSKAAKGLFVRNIKGRDETRQKIIEGDDAAFTDVNRKTRCLKIPAEWSKLMTEFWIEDGSRPTTDSTRSIVRKRVATKKYLEHTRHICTKSYREVYEDFRSKHPEITICESSFRRCKPFFVKPATQRDLELCCCQCCVTVRKAFRGLMNYRQKNKIEPVFTDVYQMVKSTLCPKPEGQTYHDLKCLKQQCEECGLKLLNFTDAEKNDDSLVTWFRYEKVDFTTKKGVTVRNLDIVKKQTPPRDLIQHLLKSLEHFPYHLFTARWQRKAWLYLIENLPADHCAIEMDFSENFTTVYQEEIQSLHWSKTQVSIHSMVVTRPTVAGDSMDNSSHVKEHWLVISDELTHDFNFVHHCLERILVPELQKLECEVSVLHQRTDGCAAQYKSVHCFGDVSRSEIDLKIPVTRSYSGSGHGKGEVDSAAGYLKTAARKAVVRDSNLSIHNAKDLYEFAIIHLKSQPIGKDVSLHARRFFYFSRSDINTARNRATFKTIKGTQKLHSVASVNVEGQLKTRMLSCYCVMCIEGKYDECENKSYVDQFRLVNFLEKPETVDSGSDHADSEYGDDQEENQLEPSADDVQNPLFEMISEESVVAVRPHSQSLDDYFLFNVTSNGMVCLPETVECCGHRYSQGTHVVEGYYYEHIKSNRKGTIYKKSANSAKIIIPVECVLYVGIDLVQAGEQYILQIQDHEDIMCFI